MLPVAAAAPAEYAVTFDMGCYELLPANQQQQQQLEPRDSVTSNSSPGTLPLWGDELGNLLLEQHQSYLTQLLQQPSLDTVPKRLRARGVGVDSSSYSQGAEFSSLPGLYGVGGGGRVLDSGDSITGSGVGRHGEDVQQPYTLMNYLRTLSLTNASSPTGSDFQQQQQRSQSERWQQPAATGWHPEGPDGIETQRQGGKGRGLRKFTHRLLGVGVLPGRHHDTDKQQQQQDTTFLSRTNSTSSRPEAFAGTTYTTGVASLGSSNDSAAAPGADMSGWRPAVVAPTVRLYQIVSPSLAGRAAVFGSHLALPDSWHCIDPPYFDAPGVITLHVGAAPAAAPPPPATAAAGRTGTEDLYKQQQQQQQQQREEILSVNGTEQAAQQAAPASPSIPDPAATAAVAAAASPPPAPQTPASAASRSNSGWSPFAAAAMAAAPPSAPASPAQEVQQQQPQRQFQRQPLRDLSVCLPTVLSGDPAAVTVVFASVDGAHQLAAHPELARWVSSQ